MGGDARTHIQEDVIVHENVHGFDLVLPWWYTRHGETSRLWESVMVVLLAVLARGVCLLCWCVGVSC